MSDTLKTLGQALLEKFIPYCNKGTWITAVNAYSGQQSDEAQKGTSYSSCNTTMHVLAESASPQFLQSIKFPILSDKKALRLELMKILDEPNFLLGQTGPNHHFILFPVSKDVISLHQGFQGVYDYPQWREYRGEGLMHRVSFIDALIDFRFSPPKAAVEGAVDMFSFRLGKTTGSGGTIRHAANVGGAAAVATGVELEIRSYYRDIRSISSIQYGRIPS